MALNSNLSVNFFLKLLIIFLAYVLTARLGLNLNAVGGFATFFWPPTGIAIALLVLFGYQIWPAIALGALTINFLNGAPIPVALGISLGNTLEGLVAVYLLESYVGFHSALDRVKDVIGLIFFGGICACTIAATVGVFSLTFSGVILPDEIYPVWLAWFVGDFLGVLVVAPLILVWSTKPLKNITSARLIEGLILTLLLILLLLLMFTGRLRTFTGSPVTFLISPFLIWATLRFKQLGAVTAMFLVFIIAVWGTVNHLGPFARVSVDESLFYLQAFIGVISATFLVMAATIAERERSEEREHQLKHLAELEEKEREFLSMASHQLMTPLALIEGYLSMILTDKYGKPDTEIKGYLQQSLKGAERMNSLVKTMLTTARLEGGFIKVEKSSFDINPLILEVLKDMRSQAEQKKLKLNFESEGKIEVLADRDHTREVISNLVSNSIKYTDSGVITIRSKKTDSLASISVADTGIGINPENLPHVFEKFYLSENWIKKQAQSNGLGLYITKLLLELMDGKIAVESQEGQGSTFTFSLPLSQKDE